MEPRRSPRSPEGGRSSRGPLDANLLRDFLQALDYLRIQRDAFRSERLHAGEALLAVHVDPLLSLGLRAVLQLPREAVHVSAELVEGPEGARIEGHEKVPNVGALLVCVDPKARRGAAQDAAQDVDHEGEAVAFVTAEVLAFAAEGEEAAAESLREGIQDAGGVGRAPARLVDGPSVGNRGSGSVVHLDLAARDRRRGHVEDERLL